MKTFKIILKLPFYLFSQVIFIVFTPIWMIVTLWDVPNFLGEGMTKGSATFKEWGKNTLGLILFPYEVFY